MLPEYRGLERKIKAFSGRSVLRSALHTAASARRKRTPCAPTPAVTYGVKGQNSRQFSERKIAMTDRITALEARNRSSAGSDQHRLPDGRH